MIASETGRNFPGSFFEAIFSSLVAFRAVSARWQRSENFSAAGHLSDMSDRSPRPLSPLRLDQRRERSLEPMMIGRLCIAELLGDGEHPQQPLVR